MRVADPPVLKLSSTNVPTMCHYNARRKSIIRWVSCKHTMLDDWHRRRRYWCFPSLLRWAGTVETKNPVVSQGTTRRPAPSWLASGHGGWGGTRASRHLRGAADLWCTASTLWLVLTYAAVESFERMPFSKSSGARVARHVPKCRQIPTRMIRIVGRTVTCSEDYTIRAWPARYRGSPGWTLPQGQRQQERKTVVPQRPPVPLRRATSCVAARGRESRRISLTVPLP